jgi:general secretion pathway protein D
LLGGAQEFIPGFGVVGGDDVSAAFDPDVVVVIPDPENNQVVVKAPIKQQGELAKLIERLDRRRAQVYLQALIVSVSDNEDYTLGFETQIKAGQFGINTDFDLGGFPAGSDFTDPKQVGLDLGGLTAAVIQSEYVPIIINANQTNTDVRILSSPQLLVNDNEEAEIVSIEEQPYNEVTNDNGVSQTGFAGFAEAGTTLRVTPSISDGGFLRLEYYVELSNFTSTEGAPPPRNTRTVTGKATIPSDATIVVGGLTVEDVRDTVIKVPFIGDIPIVGELFKKTNKVNNKAKLYVFLTPRIMTDPNFNDLKLLTQGPQTDMEIDPDAPPLEPEAIRSLPNGTAPSATPVLEPATID